MDDGLIVYGEDGNAKTGYSHLLPEGSSVQAVRWLAPEDAESLVLRCTHRNRIPRKVMAYNHKSDAERNAEIMLRDQGGESTGTLARAYGVSDRRVRAILAGERQT